ncbi:MAG: penicillin-binding protein 2 [Verrucomicrobia bacterium]|nr:penicillin-binding protein 2 [Verrucomicrobiota bacterium]MBV8378778.1 penicillin-binding protein 2 [Verrucomicrobiota bacterium]
MARPKKSSVLDFRILLLAVFILASLFAIGVRLWFVQVKMASFYRARIQGSSEVTVRIPSIRGEIRDRNGVPLVTNRPSYEVDFYLPDLVSGYKKQYGQPPMVEFRAKDANGMLHDRKEADIVQIVDRTIIPRLEELKVAEPYNSQRLRTHYRNNTLVPFTYREDLDFATFSKFAEKDLGLPGVQVNVRPVRKYVYNALAAHLLGYVGTAGDINKLADIRDFNFYEPDIQGKTNVEFYLDDALRGKPGKRILKKNAKNQLEGEKEVIQPTPGANVYLTIDARIQYITERALRAVGRAAAVVVDPNNGQILAMASVPSYDPNKFIPAISARDWASLKDADADPLTNRAISAYAPGSTYKIATALAGLTRGLAKAVFTCNGGVTYGNTYMRCWIQAEHGGTHGRQTLSEAIKNSCDAFFYQYGNAAGIDAIDAVGKSLGLGDVSGIELTNEAPGILPSPEWLRTTHNGRWSQGQTANSSIGQGYVLATPLQMAMIAATVANGGISYQPSLVYQIQEPDGTSVRRPDKIRGDLTNMNHLTPDQIELVRKGMWRVVNDSGTGARAKVPGVTVAGKTGTAQAWTDGKKDDNAWFIAFAPYDHPKLALAVLVQGGKAGGDVAAPIAAKIIEESLALEHGYDPDLKPLDPGIGNFKSVDRVDFKNTTAPAQLASTDDETSDDTPVVEETKHSRNRRPEIAEPDIRPDSDNHRVAPQPAPTPEKRHSFFDFFRRKPNNEPQGQPPPQQQQKKHHFLFF